VQTTPKAVVLTHDEQFIATGHYWHASPASLAYVPIGQLVLKTHCPKYRYLLVALDQQEVQFWAYTPVQVLHDISHSPQNLRVLSG
jgi:hypothetical protein